MTLSVLFVLKKCVCFRRVYSFNSMRDKRAWFGKML